MKQSFIHLFSKLNIQWIKHSTDQSWFDQLHKAESRTIQAQFNRSVGSLFFKITSLVNCFSKISRKTTISFTEAVVRSCFVKKVIFEVSQNSQKNACARDSFLNSIPSSFFLKDLQRAQTWSQKYINFGSSQIFNIANRIECWKFYYIILKFYL